MRAVLDEAEKKWKVSLKKEETEKLALNNSELERLTWVTFI